MKNELNFGLSLFPPKQKCKRWIHRVGGPIFVKNNPQEQKKDKINVCSVLVNRKIIYKIQAQTIEWILGIFLFLGIFWSFIVGEHVDMARLTSFHHKANL